MKKKAIFTVFCSNTPSWLFSFAFKYWGISHATRSTSPYVKSSGWAVVLRRKRYGLFMFICFLMSNSSGLAKVFSHFAASSFTLLRLFFSRSSRKNTNCLVCHSLGPRVGQKGASPCRVNSLSHRTPSCAQGDHLGLIRYAAPEETAILLIPRSSMHSSLKYTAHFLVICEPPFRWS